MPRIPGLAKDAAEMALQLFREGASLDVALNSAARLSDSSPQQLDFADDLLKRMQKARSRRQYPSFADRETEFPSPNSPLPNQLFRVNKSMTPMSDVNRTDRSGRLRIIGNARGDQAATNRIREELALAAADGDSQRMQALLVELGYMPDLAYNVASRYFA